MRKKIFVVLGLLVLALIAAGTTLMIKSYSEQQTLKSRLLEYGDNLWDDFRVEMVREDGRLKEMIDLLDENKPKYIKERAEDGYSYIQEIAGLQLDHKMDDFRSMAQQRLNDLGHKIDVTAPEFKEFARKFDHEWGFATTQGGQSMTKEIELVFGFCGAYLANEDYLEENNKPLFEWDDSIETALYNTAEKEFYDSYVLSFISKFSGALKKYQ